MQKSQDTSPNQKKQQQSSAQSNINNCDADGGKGAGVFVAAAESQHEAAHGHNNSGSVVFDEQAADKLGSANQAPQYTTGAAATTISATGHDGVHMLNQNGFDNEDDSQSDKVIDNGIMYMKGDKIFYYNLGTEKSFEDIMSDGQQQQTSIKQHKNKRDPVTRDSVLSQYLVDSSQNPLEGFDFSEIIDDEVELEKFQNSSMPDQVMIMYQYCCDFKNRADFLEKQKLQNLDCVDSLEKELENLKMDNDNMVQQLKEMKSYIQQQDQMMDMQKEQLKLQQQVLLRHNINPETLISCDTPRKRNTAENQQKLFDDLDDTQQMTSPNEMSANATKLTLGSQLDFQSGDDYLQLRNNYNNRKSIGKDDMGNNNDVLNGLQDMKNQLNQLMAQKDISQELMDLRRENSIQEHRLNQRSEQLHNYKFKVNALSDQIKKLEKDIAFYKEKYELEKDSKNTISQKVKELKVTLRQLTQQKADLQKMNRAQQKQIEHDEKIQYLYEKLLEKAEAQGFKLKSGSTREQLNKGQPDDEACKSEQQKLAQRIDIYKDEAHEGAEGEYQNSKSRNHKQIQEKNFSEISHAYDEIQSMNYESKNMKKYLNKRMPEGADLDSVIEIEELQEVLKNEDNSVIADGDKFVCKYKTFVADANDNQNEEVFIKSPKANQNADRVRGSLLIKNDNKITMAQLVKSDQLLSQQQIQEQTLIKKQQTQLPPKHYSQNILDSAKVIKEEATDENNNESNFLYNGTNLDYSGDLNSQSQDLRSAINLQQDLAARNITSGQLNVGLLKDMKELQKNHKYDTNNFVSEDQSMSTRNENIIGDQSVIESIRFYDPSECSSALKPSEMGLPPNPSRRRTHQIQYLSQDNKKLKNQIQDLKQQLETLYQSQIQQQQDVSQNKHGGSEDELKQQLKAMQENIQCIMNYQSQLQHLMNVDNAVIKQQNLNTNVEQNPGACTLQDSANQSGLFVAKNEDDKELSRIDMKNQTQIYFETNDVSIENPILNTTTIDNNNAEGTNNVQQNLPNQHMMNSYDAKNLLQGMKLRDNHVLFQGKRPSGQSNQMSLIMQSHFENSANGKIEIDSPHFRNNSDLKSKSNGINNNTNSKLKIQETKQQALFTQSQERNNSSSQQSANDGTTITKVQNGSQVRVDTQGVHPNQQQPYFQMNNPQDRHRHNSDVDHNQNNAVGNSAFTIFKNSFEKARGNGMGFSHAQMQQMASNSGSLSQPLSDRCPPIVPIDNTNQLKKIHQTFQSKADSDSQKPTSYRSHNTQPPTLPNNLTSAQISNMHRHKVKQMSIKNIFGLSNPNKIMTNNIFGIPSDGYEGLAMKQRYRALHQNLNHMKSVPAPSKHDNKSSAGEGTSSPTGPSMTEVPPKDKDTMAATRTTTGSTTNGSSVPTTSYSSAPKQADPTAAASQQKKTQVNNYRFMQSGFNPILMNVMNKQHIK